MTTLRPVMRRAGLLLARQGMLQRNGKAVALRSTFAARREFSAQPELETADGARMLVLFGSQTGTANLMAEDLQHHAEDKRIAAELMGMSDLTGQEAVDRCLADNAILTFVVSNFGAGEPADNAKAMYQWFMEPERLATKAQVPWHLLRYTVFGLGQSIAYPKNYQRVGKTLDARLAELGAIRAAPLGAGDASFDADHDFDVWQEDKLWPAMLALADEAPLQSVAPAVLAVTPKAEKPPKVLRKPLPPHFYDQVTEEPPEVYDGARPRWCEVLENERLTPASSFRQVNRIKLDLSGAEPSRLSYVTGDYAGVLPSNPPEQAMAVAERLQVSPDEPVEAMGGNSFGEVLRRYCDLNGAPRRSMLKKLSNFASDGAEARELKHLSADTEESKTAFKRDVSGNKMSVAELLGNFPSLLPDAASFVEFCPAIQPRFYSISSSSLLMPRQLELTVGMHAFRTPTGRMAHGLASHFLTQDARPGDKIPIFMQKSGYHLPKDESVPVVLIGVGSGVAPLHAFVQERAARVAAGASVGRMRLYFGAAAPDINDLYADDFEALRAAGILEVRKAYSDWDAAPKRFVQDLVSEDAEELYSLVAESKAQIYVCGHGMLGRGVTAAFRKMLVAYGGAAEEEAGQNIIEAWKDGGVLHEDIFL